ncbi:YSIRK-type signal peptide-containing protein [Limosilactobacillus sp. STM2_1]|uniref:YSIRK-type signal peptide-containing protein n=1 Tax=Limosilactobacillus rudii TaxID=2759755 RepID=A0A7W3UMZ7_9LACO|nr:YSIRK-type signal peptide-containing protein [Limosilactobacillus rudii]MBB1078860.1 YSIRK-type signal peptide-containing protein [Limosilactobacillus rudii]MBB1098065.1 YSIRK-type signal peptide-containing protein [Limosilactobacillus rudii]MCD7135135.1 YSIRK-type signal peptide-containing protein [Limosilactobacillus rudii]
MLSRNNRRELIKKQEPKQQRFTIKKLTVGVASVLLGFTFAENTTASADTDVNTDDHSASVTNHNAVINDNSSTLQQSATSAGRQLPGSTVNPAGNVKTAVADNYEAAVSTAVKQETAVSSNAASASNAASSTAIKSSTVANSQPANMKLAASSATRTANYAAAFASLTNNAVEQDANAQTVSDWNGLQTALNNTAVSQVNVQGNIYANGDATINHDVTINGLDGASINFGKAVIKGTPTWSGINLTFSNLTLTSTSSTGAVDFSQTNGENTVTFNNVNAHGASLYNGGGNTDVYIRGNVTSDVDGSAAKPTVAQLNNALGSYPTANVNNWRNANIVADNVYVSQGANLTLTRSVVGDGIDIVAGNKAYNNSSDEMGNVNVGVNAGLNITLLNGTQQNLRATEQATNIENASAAIRAYRNGSFTTGDSAQVKLNVGHGRGIVFDEPFGGSTSVQLQGNPETNWYNNRAGTNYRDYDHNEFKLGNSTNFYVHGRDGVLLGNRATMITGENSHLTFDNGGNGSGLTVDAYARVEISPHSVVLMHSDGKDHSGVWNGGNYIGLGEDGHFTVDHDATFRYVLVNRNTLVANGTNVTNFYDDNFNITSIKASSSPIVTIGDNAVFDGQSDYRNIFGEILSFSYNAAPAATTMNIHGARYINFQKYEATTPGAYQNVTALDPNGKHTGNLFYSWPHNTWTVNGNTYNAYKWDDEYYAGKEDTYDGTNAESIKKSIDAFTRDASQTWSGITDLNLDYNMHERVGGYVNNDATLSNHGVAFGAEAHGFDPEYSQRVALVATNIPTEDTTTEQQKTDYDVVLKYNQNLPAGTVKVVQKGVAGLVRKTTTTYYIVNGATGEKTLDTSKGGFNVIIDENGNVISRTPNNNPGHSTTIAEINQMVPEVIEVGPQKVTLNYVDKTTGNLLKTTTVLGDPIKTGTDNTVEFDKDGNVIPNAITTATFTDNGQTVAEIVKGYTDQGMTVTANTLATAIKNGTAQYDVKGVTRTTLTNQQAIPANGPVYEIDLNEAVKQGSITVTYYDETTGQTMPKYTYNSGEENVGTPVTYSTADTIKTLKGQGYVLVHDGFTTADVTDITAGSHKYVVTVKHGIEDVNKNNPHGMQVTKEVTRTVNYTVDGKPSAQLPTKTENANFTATGYWDKVLKQLVDVVNGQIVTENGQVKKGQLTWTADGSTKDEATMNGYPAPILDGYHVDTVSATSAGQNVTADNVASDGAVKDITITNNSNNIDVNVDLVSNGTIICGERDVPASQVVHYVGAGSETPADNVQNGFSFHYSGDIYDKVTGQKIADGKWNVERHTFNNVNVPVVKGYYANTAIVDGRTVTPANPNAEITVTYQPVGKIIPTTPDGKVIPNVPQPPYKNEPTNPTKVTPNEPVPEIPGYTPSVPTVTPTNPGKDTPVVYNQIQQADLTIVDQDNDNKQIEVSNVKTAFSAKGDQGTEIKFTGVDASINSLEKLGYVYVNSTFKTGDKYDNQDNQPQHYLIVMKHGIEDVNKNNPHGLEVTKTITRTVTYTVDGNSSAQLPTKTESADFTATGYWDKVLKQLVDVVNGQIVTENGQVKKGQLTWTADGSTKDEVTMSGYPAPVLDGYHVDAVSATSAGQNVTADNVASDGAVKDITVTSNSNNIDVKVNLVNNGTKVVDQQSIPGSQTVKFVDEDGNELVKPSVDHTEFNYSGNTIDAQTGQVISHGKWNQETHHFGNVNVPVVDGYVTDTKTAGGLTATIKDPNVTQTVIYHQVGKIIPVDPNGKPIPNVPQPPYKNDPTNPTTVTPNEPVPEIPGYVPSVPTVTPTNPTKDTPVVYNNTETAIVNYVDQSEDNKLITSSGDLTGPSGTKINYSTAATIQRLEDQGYVFVSSNYPADATFDNDMGKTQVYTVVMKHGTTTFKPDKPGVPGEPINPNYPDGPKVTKEDVDYQKDVTSTVHYEGAGEKTPADNVQNAQWTRAITVDKVTGKIISTTEWQPNKTDYQPVKTPVIDGYHADKAVVPSQKVTMDNLTTTVTYYPNGRIIPTTPDGKVIPNAPHPQYPTTPNNPTSVTPNEPVPDVPGYKPTVPTVTPTNPGKDTPVVYKQVQQADLTIVDQDNNNKQIKAPGIETSFNNSGLQGDPIKFNGINSAVNALEKLGYVYVNSTFKAGDVFANKDNQPQRYVIVMKHGLEEVNQNNPHGMQVTKTVTRTVTYMVNGKTNAQLPAKTENANFIASGHWDKVLKQLVDVVNGQIVSENGQIKKGQLTWTAVGSNKDEATLDGYPAPILDGYHVDAVSATSAGQNVTVANVEKDGTVKNVTVTNTSHDINVTINLVNNGTKIVDQQNIPGSQTIKFVDGDGNELAKTIVDHTNFTYSGNTVDTLTGKVISQGKWNQESHRFGNVNVPVIKGYVADTMTAGGLTATIKDPNVTQTVIYHQVGKIIPVDPSGKPIPNVPTVPYVNDPTNPTKVTPNEPVPEIPGYVPSVPTVTPTDPTKDTTVVYDNMEKAIVNYVDQSENDKLITSSGDLTGPSGSKINYSTAATIQQLEDQGYVFVSSNYPTGAVFDNDMGKIQTYTVVMKHGTTTFKPDKPGVPGEPINPNYPDGPKVTAEDVNYSKNVKFTVNYVGAGAQNPRANVQTAQWTRAITVDNVTGKIISTTAWKANKTAYQNVQTPVVPGYHADKAVVAGPKVTMTDENATVTYAPNGHIIPVDKNGTPIPGADHPRYPTNPHDPTSVTPNEPVPEVPGYTPQVPTVTPTNPGTDTDVPYNKIPVTPQPSEEQTAVVNYVDQTENDKLITSSGQLKGASGTKINYSTTTTIKELEARGYVFVSSNYPADATFDNLPDTTQVYTVVMKHGYAPVGPDNSHEPGTPVNPDEPNGPKWPAKDNYTKKYTLTIHYTGAGSATPANNVQTSVWTRTITIDRVTGAIISDGQFNTGWTPNEERYQRVNVPVVKGYVADKAVAGGQKTVQENITEDVNYTKVGNIVPVTPDGQPLPNVPEVPYTNDPTNPTKVIPNEPVPNVPGYTPATSTVTPQNPTEDTPVVYTKPTPVTPTEPTKPSTPTAPTPAKPVEPTNVSASRPVPQRVISTPTALVVNEARPVNEKSPQTGNNSQPVQETVLPQTGNDQGKATEALGLAALGLSGMLVTTIKKRRKED